MVIDTRASVAVIRDASGAIIEVINVCEASKETTWKRWASPDQILMRLQNNRLQNKEFMRGRTSYADLLPAHFRVLISLHTALLDETRRAGEEEIAKVTLTSLKNMVSAFIMYLEVATETRIPVIEITLHSKLDISYQFTSQASPTKLQPTGSDTNGLRVVIDNRRK